MDIVTPNTATKNTSRLHKVSRSLLLCCMMTVGSLFAHISWAEGPKIAVADNLVALLQSKPAKAKLELLKKELEVDKVKIESLEDELEKLSKQLETDGDIMAASQQEKLMKAVEDKNLDRNFLIKKYQKRQQEGQQEIVQNMKPKFLEAVKSVVEAGGYDVVIHKQALVYAGTTYDITEEITQQLNKAD